MKLLRRVLRKRGNSKKLSDMTIDELVELLNDTEDARCRAVRQLNAAVEKKEDILDELKARGMELERH